MPRKHVGSYIAGAIRHFPQNKMSKYDFRPESVNMMPSLPLLGLIACISVCSSSTLGLSHGFLDRIACSCLTILASNIWYITLTGLQCVKFQVQSLCKHTDRRGKPELLLKKRQAVVDDRHLPETTDDTEIITGKYTLRALLLHTIEFRHTPREVRLFVSRKELWYVLYPVTFAVFVLFYCIPMYDTSCTVSLITGLLSKSSYDEIRRGIYWKRSTGRKICFALATVCGFVCVSGLFVLGVTVNRQVSSRGSHPNSTQMVVQPPITNVSAVDTTAYPTATDNMIGTLLHGDNLEYDTKPVRRRLANQTNASFSTSPNTDPVSVSKTANMSGIPTKGLNNDSNNDSNNNSDNNSNNTSDNDMAATLNSIYAASIQSPNLVQMIFLYSACSYIPFFLDRTPESIRLPVLLEIMQPSVSCLAAVVLFVVSVSSQGAWLPEYMLKSPSFIAYVCLVPLAVWCCIFFIIKAARAKSASYVCCILMLVVYVKLLEITNAMPRKTHAIQQILVFVGCMCGLYIALMTVFIRMENKCIQMGWDTDNDEDNDDDYMSSDGAGIGMQGMRNISPRYCIEDVLQRVTHDIQTTEYILSHPKSAAQHAAPAPAPAPEAEAEAQAEADADAEADYTRPVKTEAESPTTELPRRKKAINTEMACIAEFVDHSDDNSEYDIEKASLLAPCESTTPKVYRK